MNEATKKCKHCQAEIDAKAKICPVCRKKQGIGCLVPILIAIGVLAVIIAIGAASTGGDTEPPISSVPNQSAAQDAQTSNSGQPTTKAADDIPTEYRSALNRAKTYSDMMHMSKQGIYDQLISEYGDKFSVDAAQYAVDNLQADYNANALEKAKTYQKMMNMSPEAIRDQLTSEYGEKFTQSEADYAVSHLQ